LHFFAILTFAPDPGADETHRPEAKSIDRQVTADIDRPRLAA